MSSRFDAAEDRGDELTALMISSTFCVFEADGEGVDAAERALKRMALPSMTGSAASGSEVAEPKMAEPFGDDRDHVGLDGVLVSQTLVGADGLAHGRDAGV